MHLDSTAPNDTQDAWLQEAQRRAKELDDGTVQPISGEEVMRKALALLK